LGQKGVNKYRNEALENLIRKKSVTKKMAQKCPFEEFKMVKRINNWKLLDQSS
jgi:hypothetical protein